MLYIDARAREESGGAVFFCIYMAKESREKGGAGFLGNWGGAKLCIMFDLFLTLCYT